MRNYIPAALFILILITNCIIYSNSCSGLNGKLNSEDNSVPFFLLKSVNGNLEIEKITLQENETLVFPRGGGSENITIILPLAEGISGDFIKASENSVLIARNKSGSLVIYVQKADGTQKELINRTSAELSKLDIKVNITGTNIKKVFRISGYNEITEDNSSPVIDMFQGKLPLGDGDYSITTEITAKQDSYKLNGELELEYFAGYYFTKLILPDGSQADMIVDLGAASSVLTKNALPKNQPVYPLTAGEVSAEGKRNIEFPLSGFGGVVKNLMACDIKNSAAGTLTLAEHTFIVLDSFKTVQGKRRIDGIIGLDILSKGGIVNIKLPAAGVPGKITLGNSSISGKSIPFDLSHGHIFIDGKFGNEDLNFLLDTGSPFSFLPCVMLQNKYMKNAENLKVHGADGIPAEIKNAGSHEIVINNSIYKCTFYTSENNILSAYGLGNSAGILGTNFLANFTEMTIDFAGNQLNLN